MNKLFKKVNHHCDSYIFLNGESINKIEDTFGKYVYDVEGTWDGPGYYYLVDYMKHGFQVISKDFNQWSYKVNE